MEGTIVNFRGSRRVKHHYQMILKIDGIDTKEKAQQVMGKTVIWKSPAGKELKGKVSNVHGNKGALRVQFETGMPGQSLGARVNIE